MGCNASSEVRDAPVEFVQVTLTEEALRRHNHRRPHVPKDHRPTETEAIAVVKPRAKEQRQVAKAVMIPQAVRAPVGVIGVPFTGKMPPRSKYVEGDN